MIFRSRLQRRIEGLERQVAEQRTLLLLILASQGDYGASPEAVAARRAAAEELAELLKEKADA